MPKPKPNPEREEFHKCVVSFCDRLETADPQDLSEVEREVLDFALRPLREALNLLAMGEVPEIFRPGPKTQREKKVPASVVQEKRWRAVFYVEALKKIHGMKTVPFDPPWSPTAAATGAVATAFFPDIATLKRWYTRIIMDKNNKTAAQAAEAKKAREQIGDRLRVVLTYRRMGWGYGGGPTEFVERAMAEGKQLNPQKAKP